MNRALADRFFPSGDAVGRRIRLGPNPKAPWRMIVGIIGNVRHDGLEAEVAPEAFLPTAQDVNGDMALAVRGDGDPAALGAAVRDAVRAVDPAVTVWRMRTMEAMLDAQMAPRRLSMLLVQGFALAALALALIGIYGVLSYTVSQRIPEIGVRMALGASPSEILRMTIGDGLRLALPGIALGVVAALRRDAAGARRAVQRVARGPGVVHRAHRGGRPRRGDGVLSAGASRGARGSSERDAGPVDFRPEGRSYLRIELTRGVG